MRQSRRRSSSSGIGKSTIASSRRRNASSRLARRFVVRIASAVEPLHPLQQVGDLDVGVAIVGVLDLGALAEDRVGLVEEQHAVDAVGLGEDPVEVLLGLADVLVDDRREVDHVEVEAEVAGDDLGRHRLAGAGVAGEQRGEPAALRRAAAQPHRRGRRRGGGRAATSSRSWPATLVGQDEVVPADRAARCAGPAARGRRRSARARRPQVRRRDARPSAAACWRAARRARTTCSGRAGRRRRSVGRARSSRPPVSPSADAHSARAARGRERARPAASGTSRDQPDPSPRLPTGSPGTPPRRSAATTGRSALGERVDRAGDQRRAAEPGLADDRRSEVRGVVAGGQAREVDRQRRAADGASGSAAMASPTPADGSRR